MTEVGLSQSPSPSICDLIRFSVYKVLTLPSPQTKHCPEKGGKLNTSQAGSVAASRAAVGQFLSISHEAFIFRTG